MLYERLPPIPYLISLAIDADFPASRLQVALTARKWGFTEPMTSFLQLFPSNVVFQNRAEFVARCAELEELIRIERSTTQERLLSPQG